MARPGRRRHLMAGVRPPVTVVEVDEHLEPECMRALRELEGAFRIDKTTALRRVVENAETDPVHAVVLHDLHLIELRAVHIVVPRARFLHLGQHRDIRALDEIRRQLRYRIHLHSGPRQRHPRRQRARNQRTQHQTFQHVPFHKMLLLFTTDTGSAPSPGPRPTRLYSYTHDSL